MELVDPIFMNILVVVTIVTGLAISAWWIIATYWMHNRDVEERLKHVKLPADLRETIAGVPPALVIFYIFTAITMIAYVIYVWLGGVTY